MSGATPLRVLHVFNRMDRGGAETWIVNVMRRIDRERFRFDFLLESDEPGAYDDEIRALGGALHRAGSPRNPLRFARAFRRTARERGPFDVIHSHVHHASGPILALAAWQGIPARIAHSHSDLRAVHGRSSTVRRGYDRGTEALIGRFATAGLATSRGAAASLFGERWEADGRWRVVPCGIDLEPFARPVDRQATRARLGLPPDALVVGHVGRFAPMKNHAVLVDVFARVRDRRPDARLLLVGDGPLRDKIERKVDALGLREAVVFAGSRADVPELLRGAMDVFVFPSVYEGLGLAIVEAQAAGLPCVIANGVPPEATVVPDLIQRRDLAESPEQWAATILMHHGARHERGAHAAIDRAILESPYTIRASVDALERAYLGR
jgi:glycosyltransferase involved in cell wall biosynthesis